MKKLLLVTSIFISYLTSYSQITVQIVSDTACIGTSTTLSSLSTTVLGNIISYKWDLDNDGLFDDANDSTIMYNFNTSFPQVVGLQVFTDFPDSNTGYFTVFFHSKPTANFMASNVCLGSATTFNNASSGSNNQYNWYFGDSESSTLFNPTHVYSFTDTFGVILIVSDTTNNCSDTAVKSVMVRGLPNVKIGVIDDTIICEDNGARLFMEISLDQSFWSTGENSDTIYILNPGWYFLTAMDSFACIGRDSVYISQTSNPILEISNDTFIVSGESIKLHVTGADIYQWTPSEGLNSNTSSDPLASPVTTTWYYVQGDNFVGCSTKDSVLITVYEKYWLDYTNVMTPNGDGKNDVFLIRNYYMFSGCSLNIYNQWGQVIFESDDFTINWDGTYNGKVLPTDTYYFTIKCDKEDNSFTGTITIMK